MICLLNYFPVNFNFILQNFSSPSGTAAAFRLDIATISHHAVPKLKETNNILCFLLRTFLQAGQQVVTDSVELTWKSVFFFFNRKEVFAGKMITSAVVNFNTEILVVAPV